MTQPPNTPDGYPSGSVPPPPPLDPPAQQGWNPAGPPPPAQQGWNPAGPPPPTQQQGWNPGGPPAPQQGWNPNAPQGGFPQQPGGTFDPKTVALTDWVFLGSGGLLFIFSFFGWGSIDAGFYGSVGFGGWSGWWVLIQLLLVATLAVRAIQIFTPNLRREIPPVALVGAGGLYLLLVLIAFIQTLASSYYGPGFGIFVTIVLAIVYTYTLALGVQKLGPTPVKVPPIGPLT